MGTYKDLTGQKFGRLTVIKSFTKNKRIYCECICECGNKTITRYDHLLTSSNTKSCGCLRKEKNRIIAKKNFTTHGLRYSRLYIIFTGMKQRCYNQKNPSYPRYGGRGIKICDEWLNDFMNFYNWAMSNGYDDKLSIDRIDVNGNYEPSNCRWETNQNQCRNRRTTHYLTYKGQTHSLREWAEIYNINSKTIATRISRGWSIKDALGK